MMRLEIARPMTMPMPTAASALMIRLRSSTRWSKNDIAAPASSSARGRGAVSGVAAVAIGYSFGFVRGFGGLVPVRGLGFVLGEIHAHQVGVVHGIARLSVCDAGVCPRSRIGSGRYGIVHSGGVRRIRWDGSGRDGTGVGGRHSRDGRHCRKGGGRGRRAAPLVGLSLQIAQVTLKRRSQISGNAAEFRHDLAEVPRQLRYLLRTEHDQRNDKDYNEMRDA